MKVLDIFSWLPAKEISLEQLEQIFIDYKSGIYNSEYIVLSELPNNVSEDILTCKNELLKEGKKVAFILKKKKSLLSLVIKSDKEKDEFYLKGVVVYGTVL